MYNGGFSLGNSLKYLDRRIVHDLTDQLPKVSHPIDNEEQEISSDFGFLSVDIL